VWNATTITRAQGIVQWRTTSAGKDANSVSTDPLFGSSLTPMTPSAAALDGAGATIAGITTDINNATPRTPPDIGAAHVTPRTNDAGVTAWVTPTGAFCPTSSSNVTVTVTNFGTATLTAVTVNWAINGAPQTPGVFTGLSVATGATTNLTISGGPFTFGSNVS